MSVYEKKRDRKSLCEREREGVCMRKREIERVCVCVCEREREKSTFSGEVNILSGGQVDGWVDRCEKYLFVCWFVRVKKVEFQIQISIELDSDKLFLTIRSEWFN
jgi:hypothetical protein